MLRQRKMLSLCAGKPRRRAGGQDLSAAICGVSDKLAAEAEVVDSGVVGMDAAKAFRLF